MMRATLRSLAASLALCALAVLSPSAIAARGGAAASTPASTPACATRGLVIWLNTQGSGAAGSTFYTVELTNLSGRTCTLSGYPRVAAVDLSGRRLGSASQRSASATPRVALAPGATASFVLQLAEVNNFPSSVCRRTTAAGLRVSPPGQSSSKVVPFVFLACSRSGPIYLSAQAVRAHG